ncbi:YihY/virulence factor BrkB family protein [Cohnella zeiphila]|uniref:YihY/virulence factor BrkB family protein n=1 Tax=Cohnella zeiphila TaxID=2761120 RepID=A0A7X0VT37_9BACL|nr:YihY/virulence factor BrkB family protein [Cohnella zeiphila]MBB6729459.1 YihY/virulence factor BrkB family protein [Cohnella zeiphila]
MRSVYSIIRSLITRSREDDLPSLAAQLSYHLILAFFPFLIFVFSLIGFFRLSVEDTMNELIRLLPKDVGLLIANNVSEATSDRNGTLLSVGLIGSVWTASGGINALIKGLNKAYGEPETRRYWVVRLVTVAATLALAGVIVLTMGLLVFGQAIEQHGFAYLGVPERWWKTWNVLQITVPVLAMFCVFLLFYRMMPNRRLTWSEAMPGSAFASVGWIAASVLFSFYVNNFGHYAKTYGSLGAIIALLVWLYMSSLTVLLGGELNAALASKR